MTLFEAVRATDHKPGGKTASSSEEKYRLVRSRLDQLGYTETVSLDSLALVVRLLNDLVQTTDSCRQLKQTHDRAVGDRRRAEGETEPLKQEIVHLTRENNALHLDLIHAADKREERDRTVQLAFRKYDAEASELRFLNAQLRAKIASDSARIDAERARMENLMIIVGASAGKEIDAIHLKTPKSPSKLNEQVAKIDIHGDIEPMQMQHLEYYGLNEAAPQMIDLVKLSETKIAQLESSLKNYVARNSDLEENIKMLREQIENREQEINRLGALLASEREQNISQGKGPRGLDDCTKNPRIEQLESQVDYLNEMLVEKDEKIAQLNRTKGSSHGEYEAKIRDLTDNLEKAHVKNQQMAADLDNLEMLLKKLERAKQAEESKNDKTKENKTKNKEPAMSQEVNKLRTELERKTLDLTNAKKQIDDLKRSSHRLQSDLSETQDALLKAKRAEKEKGDVLSKLREYNSSDKDSSDTDDLNLNVLKAENELLTQKVTDLESQNWDMARQLQTLRDEVDDHESLQSRLSEYQNRVDELENKVREQQDELGRLQSKTTHSEVDLKRELSIAQQQLNAVRQERDDTVMDLRKMEKKVEKLESDLSNVTNERNNIRTLYEQVYDDLTELRQKASTSGGQGRGQNGLGQTHAKLFTENERLKLENENLKNQVRTAHLTKPSMKTGSETVSVTELNGLEDQLQNLRNHIVEQDSYIESLKGEIDGQKEKIRVLVEQLDDSRKESIELRKKLSEAPEKHSHSAENELRLLQIQLHEKDVLVSQLDKDRDKMLDDIDNKTELIAQLESNFKSTKARAHAAEQDVISLRDQMGQLQAHIQRQDTEITELRRQVDALSNDKHVLEEQCQAHLQDARNVGMDLSALAKENQLLNHEIAKLASERDGLSKRTEEMERHVEYLQEVVNSKDIEREQVISSYRKLIQEHTEVEGMLKKLAEVEKNLKMDIVVKEKRIGHLQQTIEENQQEVGRLRRDLGAYENQCNELTKSLAAFEGDLNAHDSEKHKLVRELNAARDLAAQLQRSKDELQKQIVAQSADSETQKQRANQLEKENSVLTAQLRDLHVKIERLEQLVAAERTKNIQAEMLRQEGSSHRNHLDDHIASLSKEQSEKTAMLANVTSDLMHVKEENKALRDRLGLLELTLKNQSESLKSAEEERIDLKVKLNKVQEKVGEYKEKIADLEQQKVAPPPQPVKQPEPTHSRSERTFDSPSNLEQKLWRELSDTKKQVQKFEDALRKKQARTEAETQHAPPMFGPKKSLRESSTQSFAPRSSRNKKSGDQSDGAQVAQELLQTWKAQNEALRRELMISSTQPTPLGSSQNITSSSQLYPHFSRSSAPARVDYSNGSEFSRLYAEEGVDLSSSRRSSSEEFLQ